MGEMLDDEGEGGIVDSGRQMKKTELPRSHFGASTVNDDFEGPMVSLGYDVR